MKKRITLLVALSVFILGCSLPRPAVSQDRKPPSSPTPPTPEERARAAEVMKELRNKWLTADADEFGLEGEDAKAKVWGVMMETALPSGVATLISIRDGTASLYTTGGGGVLGGYSAKAQARQFVLAAEKHLARMKPTKEFPYPETGRVKFYVLTRAGVYTVDVDDKALWSERHALHRLYRAGHEVLTGLRLASEKK
ncbi:MAG TPA: hypothetical protein VE360_09705 [Pyrinomonadaceae bacterium]|nr:hypothetical protein [Pyrinomonadaceae bacterium]